jgi:hypothetical protein
MLVVLWCIPFVDFLFVHLLESGPLQISVGVLQHVQGFGRQCRATDLRRPCNPGRDERLLRSARAVALGGDCRHQISKALEGAERSDRHGAGAVERHEMEEPRLARRSRILRPQRVAKLVARAGNLVRSDLSNLEIGREADRSGACAM